MHRTTRRYPTVNRISRLALPLGAALALAVGVAASVVRSGERPRETRRAAGEEAVGAPASPTVALDQLRPGDVVLARGSAAVSYAVLVVSGNFDAWTHAGIVTAGGADGAGLVHAAPELVGERGEGVEQIPVARFLAERSIKRAVAFRSTDAAAALRAAGWAARAAGAAIDFDQDFDLSTKDSLYCTELIYRAYADTGTQLLPSGPKRITWRSRTIDLVLPDQLAASPLLQELGSLK